MKTKQQSKHIQQTAAPADYDSAWKDVIEGLFEPFLEFFFPQIHRDIDFNKGYEFLSKELRHIFPDGNMGKRYADELVKVHLKDGSVKCIAIFVHIEVQGKKEKFFPERTYVYNYRIYDNKREGITEVISLVILTDEDPNYRPDEYRVSRWGFELLMKYPLVKIIDYQLDEEKKMLLVTSENPMALVVKAQLKSYEAKKADAQSKFNIKFELVRQCYRHGYTRKQVDSLLKFTDWIIRLPGKYKKQLKYEVEKLEEENKMPYVTSWERLAREEGIKTGIKTGMKTGKIETAKKLISKGIDLNIIAESTGLSIEEITTLALRG
ncbi:MAG: transposase [Candidatus Aminicenantes bacterium]|nr:transposase [Candidatus Aminicenantes bacterium]